MKGHKVLWVVCLVVAMAFAVAACGDDESSSGGSESTGQTKGAKAIDVASMDSAKGDVTYCTGKDTSGDLKEGIAEFNKANPDMNAKLLEFPESADEQRNQFIQRQRAKSADCDAFESDVVWTAEFASQKWLLDMTPYVEKRKAEFVPSTLSSVDYEGKIWGVPRVSDAGLLYYRKDEVKEAAATWQEVYEKAKAGKRHRLPGRGLRGPDGEFPRAGLRGRRQDPLRRRQEVRHRLAREPEGAAVHGRRHQGRRGPQGRDDLHGGGGPPGVRGRPCRLRAPVALRLRARQHEGLEGRRQVRGRAVPGLRGRRQGRHPRRPQLGRLRLLEEPGWRAEAHRLPDVGEADDQERRQVLQDADARRRPTRTRRSRRRCRSSTSSSRRSSRPRAGPSRRSTPRSRRPSTRT